MLTEYTKLKLFWHCILYDAYLYVLPYGQMSLWGLITKPQMYNICLIYLYLLVSNYSLLIFKENSDYILAQRRSQRRNLYTPVKLSRLKGKYRIGPHNYDVLSIIFGSLLGDAHGEKREMGTGTRIAFYQESSHVEYMLYLHNLLSSYGYCNATIPVVGTRLGIGGKVRKTVRFTTWTYTSFNWIHELWYVNGRKCVPDCISGYLTPLALAIWIMDDGGKVGKGLKFSTNSFSYKDCLKLVSALDENFGIKSSIQSAGAGNQYIIYVWKESMDILREIVNPYMVKQMRYKID